MILFPVTMLMLADVEWGKISIGRFFDITGVEITTLSIFTLSSLILRYVRGPLNRAAHLQAKLFEATVRRVERAFPGLAGNRCGRLMQRMAL